MSNYYYKTFSGIDVSLNNIVRVITNTNAYNSFGNSGLTLQTNYASSFLTTSVGESVAEPFGYSYNGTDISTYCIAPYIEYDGSTNYGNTINIPNWCKKIRVLLLGGGGGGGTAQASQQEPYPAVNIQQNNYNDNNNVEINAPGPGDTHDQSPGHRNDHHNAGQGALNTHGDHGPNNVNQNKAAGVHHTILTSGQQSTGGSFLYLSDVQVGTASSCQVQVGTGGSTGSSTTAVSGGTTVLKIGSTTIHSRSNYGTTFPLLSTNTAASWGSYLSNTATTTIKNYGKAGTGGVAVSGPAVPGQAGTNGYYRIYFLAK
jgi:hypothetical protein